MNSLRIAALRQHPALARRLAMCLVFAALVFCAQTPRASEPAAAADAERDTHNLVLLAPAHPVLVQIRVQVDGRGLKSVRTAYAAQLVKLYDKDGDGVLDRDEAKLVPPLVKSPTARETVSIADRWEAVDLDPADDKVSVDELAGYIDRIFGSPFLLSFKQPATQSADLIALLDVNRDGRLSQDEFEMASRILHKLDIDDDETFSIDELQPFRNPQIPQAPAVPTEQSAEQPFLLLDDADSIAQAAGQLLQRYGKGKSNTETMGLDREALAIDEVVFSSRDADGNGILDKSELTDLLANPVPQLVVEAQLLQKKPGKATLLVIDDRLQAVSKVASKTVGKLAVSVSGIGVELQVQTNRASVSDNRTFYITKFKQSDGDKNNYISESEFGAVGLANADFKSVDRNGDGMIVLDELLAYVDQDSASSQGRVELEISHKGKTVFDVIDTNHDRRISRRELAHAFESLRPYDLDGDGAISAVELAGRFQAVLQLGKPVLFRNNPRMGGNAMAPIANKPSAGPDWFRRMDRNRDGDVSLREFLGPLAAFKKLDTDNDGLISAAEAEKAGE
jgi:Ca2+-binding EF-hand superfamily protein